MSLLAVEALLEAIYLKPLTDLIASVHGKRVLRVIKPSQRAEKMLGFDQAWVRTDLDVADFLDQLGDHLAGGPATSLYFGYFLQYKAPQKMTRRSRNQPPGMSLPYHRCTLSTLRGSQGHQSQHEVLRKLSGIRNAFTYYCVPEVFCADDVYDAPDLSRLRLFDVRSAPDYVNNETHYICFEPGSDKGLWMSEPLEVQAFGARSFAQRLVLMTGPELADLVRSATEIQQLQQVDALQEASVPGSLCIVEVSDHAPVQAPPALPG